MANYTTNNISIEGAQIRFRNFSGKASQFNPAGKRNFCVLLEKEIALSLELDGWNVRWLKARDEGEEDQGYLQVAVNYDNKPPKIIIMSSTGKTVLDEESVSILDWAEISEIDLIITPYNWTIQEGTKNEKKGIKAYLKSAHILIYEDEFEKKWANAPDSAIDSIGGCGNCEACDGSCKCNGH